MTIVDCRGNGRERGLAHGESMREKVRDAIGRWADATMDNRRGLAQELDISAYARRLLDETSLFETVSHALPDLADEVCGVADGAGLPLELIAAYNLMDEQWWYGLDNLAAPPASEPGCSVIALSGLGGGGTTVLAQNMDLPAYMDGSQIVLRIRDEGKPESLILSSAGLLGLTGVNRTGVGICVNTLLMLQHNRAGVPVAFALRHALEQDSTARALAALQSMSHASGQHYAIADRAGVSSIEYSAAGGALRDEPHAPLLHTNHPLYSHDVRAESMTFLQASGRIHNSAGRLAFLKDRVSSLRDAADIQSLLADPSTPLCVRPRPGSSSQTFGSVLYQFDEETTASFCLGQPGHAAWQQVPFADR